jgi:hypothetical protein
MDSISHSSLKQLVFETTSIEFRDKNTISRFDGFDDHGHASLVSGDVEITFLWRTKSVEEMNTDLAVYQIEVDHSAPVVAEINRVIIGENGEDLDEHATSVLLVALLRSHVGWLIAVDEILSQPRLNLVSSLSSQANNPHPNLVRF